MIGLVGCAAQKLDRPAPARELYTSPLFRLALAYAEARCLRVYVLSALHGLVQLDQVLEPYEHRLGRRESAAWAGMVALRLFDRHGLHQHYLVLAGADYAAPLAAMMAPLAGDRPLEVLGVHVPLGTLVQPLRRLTIGGRLRFLSGATRGAA